MLYKIKSVIKVTMLRYPALYKIVYKLGMTKGQLTNRNTVLCLEGYPSSANSFSLNLAKEVLQGKPISSHTHAVANIKLALDFNIPIIFISREPIQAVSSHIIRHKKDLHEACLKYLSLYTFVSENKNKIKIIDFYSIVKEPLRFIELISDTFAMGFIASDYVDVERKVKNHIVDYEKHILKNTGELGLLPDKSKEGKKDLIKKNLKSHPLFLECENIYKTIQPE